MRSYSSNAKQDRAYSQPEDVYSYNQANPDWTRQTSATLANATAQGDDTTNYYFDLTGYRYFSLQIDNTAGATGTNTYKVYASVQNDGTAAASCVYEDVTNALFGAASFTTNALLICDDPQTFKYVKVEVVRTGDGGSTDGAWSIYLKESW